MGDIKQTTNDYTGTMSDMWKDYKEYLNDIKTLCIQTPVYVRKHKIDNSIFVNTDKAEHKLCDIYEQTIAWTTWIGRVSQAIVGVPINTVTILCRALGESLDYALSIIEKGVDYATKWLVETLNNLVSNSKWIKKIVKALKITILFAKKCILYGKRFVYKSLRWVLQTAANGKVTNALYSAYVAVINFIQANIKIIDTIMQVITNLLNSLIGFTLDGGAMGFFITPKSILSGITIPAPQLTMTPMNINQDIFTNIADSLISPLEEAIRTSDVLKKNSDALKMTSDIATNAAAVANGGELEPISTPEVDPFDLTALKTSIAVVLSTLALPEPMPKYERLSVTNLGYLTWLITSFEPTMKKCFGFPGYP